MTNQTQWQNEDSREVGFGTLVLLFSTGSMVHLDASSAPGSGETKTDLVEAKQMIDLLDVLKSKTAGNLTDGGSGLLDTNLFDLRMRYLEAVKRA